MLTDPHVELRLQLHDVIVHQVLREQADDETQRYHLDNEGVVLLTARKLEQLIFKIELLLAELFDLVVQNLLIFLDMRAILFDLLSTAAFGQRKIHRLLRHQIT